MKERDVNDPSTNPPDNFSADMLGGNLRGRIPVKTLAQAGLVLPLVLAACKGDGGYIPPTEILASETQPRVTEVFETQTPTPEPSQTPTPEPEVLCPENPAEFLFTNELSHATGMMVPVIAVEDAQGSFPAGIPAGLFDQVASGIADTIRANPGSINRIVYPEYLQYFDNTDISMQARVMEKLAVYGIYEAGVELVAFSRDNQANLSGEDTIWMVAHVGRGGKTTIPWKNARVGQRQDADQTARILGDMMTVTVNENGNLELRTLPGSQLYGSPDIAQVPGCSPVIIQTTPDGLHVTAVLEDEPDFSDPDTLWATNPDIQTEVLSLDFSERFGLGFSEKYVANVDGLQIPIGIGLEYWVTERSDQQVNEIHIAPDIVDILGDIYLRSCHYRYTKLMGNDISYEAYLDLVRNGGGRIEIMAFDETRDVDTVNPELVMVDPAKGISFVFADQSLPIKYNDQWNFYMGVDGRGRLNTAVLYNAALLNAYNQAVEIDGREMVDNVIVRDGISGILEIIGVMDNECMGTNTIPYSCREASPPDFRSIFEILKAEMRRYVANTRNPLFNVVR